MLERGAPLSGAGALLRIAHTRMWSSPICTSFSVCLHVYCQQRHIFRYAYFGSHIPVCGRLRACAYFCVYFSPCLLLCICLCRAQWLAMASGSATMRRGASFPRYQVSRRTASPRYLVTGMWGLEPLATPLCISWCLPEYVVYGATSRPDGRRSHRTTPSLIL